METLLLKPDLVICSSKQTSVEGLFQEAYACLHEKGYVTSDFIEALLKREQEHPTAIALETVNIAIPHAEPQYVKENCILAVSLQEPVKFQNILDQSDTLVSLVFFLVLSNGKIHVKTLSRLMQIVQDHEQVTQIMACRTSQEMYAILSNCFNK